MPVLRPNELYAHKLSIKNFSKKFRAVGITG